MVIIYRYLNKFLSMRLFILLLLVFFIISCGKEGNVVKLNTFNTLSNINIDRLVFSNEQVSNYDIKTSHVFVKYEKRINDSLDLEGYIVLNITKSIPKIDFYIESEKVRVIRSFTHNYKGFRAVDPLVYNKDRELLSSENQINKKPDINAYYFDLNKKNIAYKCNRAGAGLYLKNEFLLISKGEDGDKYFYDIIDLKTQNKLFSFEENAIIYDRNVLYLKQKDLIYTEMDLGDDNDTTYLTCRNLKSQGVKWKKAYNNIHTLFSVDSLLLLHSPGKLEVDSNTGKYKWSKKIYSSIDASLPKNVKKGYIYYWKANNYNEKILAKVDLSTGKEEDIKLQITGYLEWDQKIHINDNYAFFLIKGKENKKLYKLNLNTWKYTYYSINEVCHDEFFIDKFLFIEAYIKPTDSVKEETTVIKWLNLENLDSIPN